MSGGGGDGSDKPTKDPDGSKRPAVGPASRDLVERSLAAWHERGLGAESVKAADEAWEPPSEATRVPDVPLSDGDDALPAADPLPPLSKDVAEEPALTDPEASPGVAADEPTLPVDDADGHYETKPEDRIPFLLKVVYGIGAFVNNTLAAAIGEMIKVLNLAMGVDPAIVGWIGALPRLTDALTDPLMGYVSDHTRSRWGRRRPYILVGAIAAGVLYIALWMFPLGQSETFYFVWFVVGSLLFYLAYTVYATPWVALGYELTPDYHERTRLMGVQNFIGQLAYVVSPWFMWVTTLKIFRDQVQGAAVLAVVIGVAVMCLGVLPAVFLRERFVKKPKEKAEAEAEAPVVEPPLQAEPEIVSEQSGGPLAAFLDFFKGLFMTLSSGPFLLLAGATFLVFNGFILIGAFQYYVIVYYIFGGNQELGAEYAGYSGSLGAVSTFIVIPIVTWLATRVGKRRAFFIAIGISIVGYSLKWFCYDPEVPLLMLLPAPLMAFGLGGLFTLMGSMIADVVDVDELTSYQRREGMFGSIFWWVVKLGMAVAIAAGGYLLNFTGFDVELGGNQAAETLTWMRAFDAFVPAATSVIAIALVWFYPITEEVAHETREELERRRAIEG